MFIKASANLSDAKFGEILNGFRLELVELFWQLFFILVPNI